MRYDDNPIEKVRLFDHASQVAPYQEQCPRMNEPFSGSLSDLKLNALKLELEVRWQD